MSGRIKKLPERPDVDFDVLGDIFQTLRFSGSIFFQSELAAPWGMSLTPVGFPRFHIALLGDCFAGSDDDETVKVQEMDIVMLPNGDPHWIADQPGRELVSSQSAGDACELGNPLFQNGEITNRIMCGLVRFDEESSHPILDALPKIVHFPKHKTPESIWMTVMSIGAEIRRAQNHRTPIVDRLTEVLFLQLLNHYVNENGQTIGFLAALSDRRVRRLLGLIHSDPGFDWSLSTLGAQAGMSRATLLRHFQHAAGMAPMEYIWSWRLMKAYNAIKYTSAPLPGIATTMGFTSSKTLARAFERKYGYTPHKLRQASRDDSG